jgi:hypothetical protein
MEYLLELGVDLSRQVELLVTTHWHDDHAGGLARMLTECPDARFCLSSALTRDEFHVLVRQYQSNPPSMAGSRLSELDKVFRHLRESSRTARRANQGRALYRLDRTRSGHGHECVITSLSPSDFSEQSFIDQISSLFPKALEAKRPMLSLTPNAASVALWIEIGDHRILLCADLEDSADNRRGWKAYLLADNCPSGKATFVKVAHHGSKNGHNDEVWTKRIEPSPIAITTPWERGGRSLPTIEDVVRIRSLSRAALTTAVCTRPRLPRRPASVLKQLKESNVVLQPIRVGLGAVRCRTAGLGHGIWCIDFLGSAGPL